MTRFWIAGSRNYVFYQQLWDLGVTASTDDGGGHLAPDALMPEVEKLCSANNHTVALLSPSPSGFSPASGSRGADSSSWRRQAGRVG